MNKVSINIHMQVFLWKDVCFYFCFVYLFVSLASFYVFPETSENKQTGHLVKAKLILIPDSNRAGISIKPGRGGAEAQCEAESPLNVLFLGKSEEDYWMHRSWEVNCFSSWWQGLSTSFVRLFVKEWLVWLTLGTEETKRTFTPRQYPWLNIDPEHHKRMSRITGWAKQPGAWLFMPFAEE